MTRNKKSLEGRDERIEVLLGAGAISRDELNQIVRQRDYLLSPRPGHDDILDALALAVTAQVRNGLMVRIPRNPSLDGAGLPMQMVY